MLGLGIGIGLGIGCEGRPVQFSPSASISPSASASASISPSASPSPSASASASVSPSASRSPSASISASVSPSASRSPSSSASPSSSGEPPAFSNVLAAYGLNNFDPANYFDAGVEIQGAETNISQPTFSETTPYPLNWQQIFDNPMSPPWLTTFWFDQNATLNNLGQSGSARPTMQLTTPVIVSGAGTSAANGTYTYRGQLNGFPYYNLVGQVSDPTQHSIAAGSNAFQIFGTSEDSLYDAPASFLSFPWLAEDPYVTNTGANPVPSVAAGTQVGEIQFDGSSDCLATAGSLTLGTAATAYLRFKTTDVASTDILFEIGATPTATPFALSVRLVAGVLTCTITDGTGLLFNTKTYNVSSNTWYIITVIVDSTQGTPSNQVKLLVSNSTSGVSSPVSTDLASGNLADGVLNVGSRNQSSSFLAGSMTDLLLFSVAHSSSTATSWYDYINSVLYP